MQAVGLLNAIVGAGKDALARIYGTLVTRDRSGQDQQPAQEPAAAGAGSETLAGGSS